MNLWRLQSRISDHLCGRRIVLFQFPGPTAKLLNQTLKRHYPISSASIGIGEIRTVLRSFSDSIGYGAQTAEASAEEILLYLLYLDKRLVVADCSFSECAQQIFQTKYKFVALLEDPLVCFYYSFLSRFEDPGSRGLSGSDFEEFLFTDEAFALGASYVARFSGAPADGAGSAKEAMSKAKKNIKKFDLVGTAGRFDDFERGLRKLIGGRARVRLGQKHPVAYGDDAQYFDTRVFAQVESVNSPNREFYDFVKGEVACIG